MVLISAKPVFIKTVSVCVSVCVHMCIQDFIDELNVVMPSITMENNVIHNNEGYGVILVKPNTRVPLDCEGNHNTTLKKRTSIVLLKSL